MRELGLKSLAAEGTAGASGTRESKGWQGAGSGIQPRLRFGLLGRLHCDERGTISILSVFAVLLLAMLLGMVMNIGRQANNKVQMQNAADAGAYAGSVVMARGMNTLAFTNHLLCDVFALTAFMREARDRHGEPLVPEILAAWTQAGQKLSTAEFEKFKLLGPAILQKVPDEQQMVASYLTWGTAASNAILPMLEEMLQLQLIREYQTTVRYYTSQLAQDAANETAIRHGGLLDDGLYQSRGPMQAQFVATYRNAWGYQSNVNQNYNWSDLGVWRPMLPCLDPLDWDDSINDFVWEEEARDVARQQRRDLAYTYLRMWNSEAMAAFRTFGKMGQFSALWNGFTCGQLDKLLDENFEKNHPFLIPDEGEQYRRLPSSDRNAFLEGGYIFMCVVYWPAPAPFGPKWFDTPVEGDNIAYAQSMMFIPQNRLIRVFLGQGGEAAPPPTPIGGVPGEFVNLPSAGDPPTPQAPPDDGGESRWIVVRESRSTQWDLLNQSWRAQLMPATHPGLAAALRILPQFDSQQQPTQDVSPPDFSDLTAEDLSMINHH